jgi:hypothetical protein
MRSSGVPKECPAGAGTVADPYVLPGPDIGVSFTGCVKPGHTSGGTVTLAHAMDSSDCVVVVVAGSVVVDVVGELLGPVWGESQDAMRTASRSIEAPFNCSLVGIATTKPSHGSANDRSLMLRDSGATTVMASERF